MIDMQLLDGTLLALAIVVGAALALSIAMVAAATFSQRGQPPRGGTRRDQPRQPVPDDDLLWQSALDDDKARELVLR